jgi:outer membrane lipoprotein SlyB
MISARTWKTIALTLAGSMLLGVVVLSTSAQPVTPKAQYNQDSDKAAARYDADRKLCDDESNASARLQCRRDAKSEYDNAIKDATAQRNNANKPAAAKASCITCAKVLSVSQHERDGESSPLGMIAGGVTGAILGRQVGGGFGKDLATIAGAAGGAYAGRKIEERAKSQRVWTVNVQYADGHQAKFEFEQDPGFMAGDAVRNSGNTLVRD